MSAVRRRSTFWFALASVAMTAIGSARIVSTYRIFSHTIDEPAHLAAGMQWLDQHRYDYQDLNPPLARIAGALIPYLAGERSYRAPFYWEGAMLLGRAAHYDRVLALGRSGILIFFWIGSACVFLWAFRIGGGLAGALATAFFTTTPPILAHSGLITTDMALTAFMAEAAVGSLWWVRQPTAKRSIVLGVSIAGAMLSKFSSLPFLACAWTAMFAWHSYCDRPDRSAINESIRARIQPSLYALAVAAIVVWAAYRFSFGRTDFLGPLRVPAPHFWNGLRDVWAQNTQGARAYLLGGISQHGFWYYYPVVLAIKTPLAMLILVFAAAFVAARRRLDDAGLPIAFSAGILLFALSSNINIGVRHVLPVYAGLAVACGAAMARSSRWLALGGALLAWQVVAGIATHPDYLAYTNELAGSHPEKILVDSDLDWGQDMNRLADFFANAGAKRAAISVLNFSYSVDLGHDLPPFTPVPSDRPAEGWNAVSVSFLELHQSPLWAKTATPLRRVGRTIYVWYVAPEISDPGPSPDLSPPRAPAGMANPGTPR